MRQKKLSIKPTQTIVSGRVRSRIRPANAWLAATLAVMTLSACDQTGGTGPGGVSEGEASALEDAAEMLDERRLPEEALPAIETPPLAGEEPAEMTGDNTE